VNPRRIQIALVTALASAVAVFAFALHRFNHGSAAAPGTRTTSEKHSLAPDFSLPQLNGETLNLSDYRGKVVLLDFWATWCDPCRDEVPHFVELQNRYGDQGFQVIGVSMDDSPEPVRDFYQQFKMNYPVVMGNARTGELYGGVLGLPIAFLVGRDGRIDSRHTGAIDLASLDHEIATQLQR
jgi:peroxiredoxin